jgi:hypothetical protein
MKRRSSVRLNRNGELGSVEEDETASSQKKSKVLLHQPYMYFTNECTNDNPLQQQQQQQQQQYNNPI